MVNIVSYDTGARLAEALKAAKVGVAICDEAHFLKSHSSVRCASKGLAKPLR